MDIYTLTWTLSPILFPYAPAKTAAFSTKEAAEEWGRSLNVIGAQHRAKAVTSVSISALNDTLVDRETQAVLCTWIVTRHLLDTPPYVVAMPLGW